MKKFWLAFVTITLLAIAGRFVWPVTITEPEARAEAIANFKLRCEQLHLSEAVFEGPYPVGGPGFGYEWVTKEKRGVSVSQYSWRIYGMSFGYASNTGDPVLYEWQEPQSIPAKMTAAKEAAYRAEVMTVPPSETAFEYAGGAIMLAFVSGLGWALYHFGASWFAAGPRRPVSGPGFFGFFCRPSRPRKRTPYRKPRSMPAWPADYGSPSWVRGLGFCSFFFCSSRFLVRRLWTA